MIFKKTVLLLLIFYSLQLSSQKEEKIKKGWTFGAVPAVGASSDVGIKYGGLINLYHYGDGSTYPRYRHSIYTEWSRTTKGSGINMLRYDSDYLIPDYKLSIEASLLSEKILDFYGFNGYESYYDKVIEEDENSELFYRIDRKLGRIKADIQGKIVDSSLRWMVGFAYNNNKISTVDFDKFYKNKKNEGFIHDSTLYDHYVNWGIIANDQSGGGITTLAVFGLIYDTRDNEPNPMKGIWTEIQFLYAPMILGNGDYAYSRLVMTHRQYFTLIKKKLSFVYRLSYQAKLSGKMPFYMLPFVYNTSPNYTRDGLGGEKTIRGILRNRIVGEDFIYGNLEFRWKIIRTVVFNQNLYIALNSFVDFGMITRKYQVDVSNVPAIWSYLFLSRKEGMHTSLGSGLKICLNENFIVSADVGSPLDKNDGNIGFYIGMNFLF